MKNRALFAAICGGVVGALSRWGLGETLPSGDDPATILAINIVGCLAMGLLMAWVNTGRAPQLTRPLLGVGFLGGFTTFSAYAGNVVVLAHDQQLAQAFGYLALTLVGCMAAVLLGTVAGDRLVGNPRATESSEGAER